MKLRHAVGYVVASLVVALSPAAAAPADVSIDGNGTRQTRDCDGGNAMVSGNENRLTLRNCATVSVLGNGNTVRVERASVISVPGNHNTVTWMKAEGAPAPRISNPGTDNRIREAPAGEATADAPGSSARGTAPARESTPARGAKPFVLDQNGRTLTHDCGGGPALITGNRNNVTLRNCASVSVNGNSNVVDTASVRNLTVVGNDNSVAWHPAPDGGEPTIVNTGDRNSVVRR